MLEVKIIDCTVDPLASISYASRTAYNSHEKEDIRKREEFVRARLKNGEDNLLEHAYVQLEISGISRACLQQLVRHRQGVVYTVQSQRYVSQENAEFIEPDEIYHNPVADAIYQSSVQYAKEAYKRLLNMGIKKEDARYLLPESSTTRLVVTYNLRALRHLLRMRLNKRAQWEIRALVAKVKEVCTNKWGSDFFAEGL